MDIHCAAKRLVGLSKPLKIALAAAIAVVVLSAAYVGVAKATDQPAFCFQGHPEASPGPHEIAPLFDRFIALMNSEKNNNA